MVHIQYLFPLFLVSNAAPVLNNTLVHWTEEPATRGTAGILFSCIVSLGLCIWTAVHLNVEPIESSETRITFVTRVAGKITWAITALIAPELVLTIALHQLLVALEYRSIVNKRKNGGKGEESWREYIRRLGSNLRVWPSNPPHKTGSGDGGASTHNQDQGHRNIGLKTAFYAIMGGFALRTTPTTALTITLDMLLKKGTMEIIRQYPPTAIDDKSKADLLAKVVACFQAGWMIVQCLGRKLGGLPITLLELNTVVHVLNAIAMYLLWFSKPVDVGEPSSIDQVYGDKKKEGFFVGVDVLNESLETVIKEHLPKFSGVASHEDIDSIKAAHELEKIVDFCTTAYKKRLDPPLASFPTVLQAGVALGSECGEVWRESFERSLSGGMEIISPFTDYGTALRNHKYQVREICREALQKAFHSANDEIDDGVDNGIAHGGPQKTHVDRATLGDAIRKCISSTLASAFRNAFESVKGNVRGAVRHAAIRAVSQPTHHQPSEERQAVMREAFFGALPGNLESELQELRPMLHGILRRHLDSDAALAVLNVICLVVAPSPGTYGEKELAPSSRLSLFEAIIDALPGATDETSKDEIYKAVFDDLRKRSYNIAEMCHKNSETLLDASQAAFKAAFHLNTTIVQVPLRTRNKKTSFWGSVFNADLITNQFISFPKVEDDSPNEFGKSWQLTHAKRLWLFSVLASAFYGGMHALKWYAQFPTTAERLLWQISSCVGAAGILPITAFGPDFFDLLVPGADSRFAWRVFGFLTGLLFVLARSYIIVESFLSLRRLPQSAYQAVSWTNSIPHV